MKRQNDSYLTREQLLKENKMLRKQLDIISREAAAPNQTSLYARNLIEVSPDPLVTISYDGKISDVNEATIKATGVSREELIGTNFSNYFTDREQAETGYQQVFAHGSVTDYPLTIRHRNGQLMDVLYNATLYKDIQGKVLGVFAAARNVTARKQASLYARSLIEASLDPLVTISSEGKITDVNEATIKATGFSREELIGTNFSNYFTEPDKADQGYRQVFTHGAVTNYPLTIRHRNGHLIDVLYNATLYRDTHGNVHGVFAAARDVTAQNQALLELKGHKENLEVLVKERTIELQNANKNLQTSRQEALKLMEEAILARKRTESLNEELRREIGERKKAEEALRGSEERLRSVLESSLDTIYRLNLQSGHYEYFSPASTSIYGFTPEEMVAMDPQESEKRVHPDDREAVAVALAGLSVSGERTIECRWRNRAGEYRWLSTNMRITRDAGGRPIYRDGIVRDITESKKAETILHETQIRTTSILEGIADTFYSLDLQWRFTVVNPAAEKAPFGRTAAELLGKVIWDLYPNLLGTAIHRHYLDAMEKKTLEHYVAQSPLNERWYEVFMQGWQGGVDVYMRDITERKLAEEAIAASQIEALNQKNRLEAVMETLPVGVAIVDGYGGILSVNRMYEQIWGSPRPKTNEISDYEAFKAWHVDTRLPVKPEEWASAIAVQKGEAVVGQTFEIERFDGSHAFILNSAVPILNSENKVSGSAVAIQDITIIKRNEEQIIRQSSVLQGINMIFEQALAAETMEDLGRTCLKVAENLTGSKFGFIGEIDSDGIFHDIAISDPGWELSIMFEKTGHRKPPGKFPVTDLYKRVLSNGKSLITNEPSGYPDSTGVPENHSHLEAFLGVPLKRSGATFGIIAVGNRTGGYRSEDMEILDTITPAIVYALDRKKAEEEIERLSRFPIENPNPVMRVSSDGIVIFANKASRILLESWGIQVGDSLPEQWWGNALSVMREGKNTVKEMECGEKTFNLEIAFVNSSEYVNIYGLDVTERKRYEKALRETRDYLDKLLRYANAPVIVWDPRKRITLFNQAFEKLTGYSADEIIGHDLEILFPQETKKQSLERIELTAGGEYWETVEIPILRKDGNVRIALWNSANITASDGITLAATIAQGQDITERIYAEKELAHARDNLEILVEERTRELSRLNQILQEEIVTRKIAEDTIRENESRLEQAQHIAHLGYWEWDIRTNELYWSKETFSIFGLEPFEFTPTYEKFLECIHPEDTDKVIQSVNDAIQKKNIYNIEHRLIKEDQTVSFVNEQGEVIYDLDERAVRMVGTVLDITPLKISEQKRLEAVEIAEKTSRLATIGAVTGGITHEINQPLNAIKVTVDGILFWYKNNMGLVPEQFIGMLNKISASVERINTIIKHMRSFWSSSDGEEREIFNVNAVVISALSIMMRQLSSHGIKVVTELSDSPLLINGVPIHLEQVVINLVNNSMKALDAVSRKDKIITIHTSIEEGDARLEIKDNGKGFAEGVPKQLFDPFFTTRKPGEGMGLGLTIVKQFVEEHKGVITCKNNPSGGAIFTLTFPISQTNRVNDDEYPSC